MADRPVGRCIGCFHDFATGTCGGCGAVDYPPEHYLSAWEVCWKCRGAGIEDGMNGPVACSECHGECTVRARDEHGRFTRVPVPDTTATRCANG